jgi:hypothetical protein
MGEHGASIKVRVETRATRKDDATKGKGKHTSHISLRRRTIYCGDGGSDKNSLDRGRTNEKE